jgi:hypothetical protein
MFSSPEQGMKTQKRDDQPWVTSKMIGIDLERVSRLPSGNAG